MYWIDDMPNSLNAVIPFFDDLLYEKRFADIKESDFQKSIDDWNKAPGRKPEEKIDGKVGKFVEKKPKQAGSGGPVGII